MRDPRSIDITERLKIKKGVREELEKRLVLCYGGKACGAGGGGCLLFFCGEGRTTSVKRALTRSGGEIIPFKFAEKGLTWEVAT